MRVSVIGLAGCGKTTLVEAMMGQAQGSTSGKPGLVTVHVPDERIDKLVTIFRPAKTVYADLRLEEIPWIPQEMSNRRSAAEKYVKNLSGCDLLIHVVRAFENPYLSEGPDPARDLASLDAEMILADLMTCENFFDRHKKRPSDPNVLAAIKKTAQALENETFLSRIDFTDYERKALGGFGFSTLVPQLILVNRFDQGPESPLEDSFRTSLQIPLGLAREVAELPEEEQAEFLDDLGLKEPLVHRLSRATFHMMGLISFFTVGEDEVRAWPIPADTPAQKAAGKIHTDMERGFIKAEVVGFETFMELGTLKACRDAGKLRMEGKSYIVRDGDIVSIRFNV